MIHFGSTRETNPGRIESRRQILTVIRDGLLTFRLFLKGVVGSRSPSPGLCTSNISIALLEPQYNLGTLFQAKDPPKKWGRKYVSPTQEQNGHVLVSSKIEKKKGYTGQFSVRDDQRWGKTHETDVEKVRHFQSKNVRFSSRGISYRLSRLTT